MSTRAHSCSPIWTSLGKMLLQVTHGQSSSNPPQHGLLLLWVKGRMELRGTRVPSLSSYGPGSSQDCSVYLDQEQSRVDTLGGR